jgi:iron-sulfur cluster assembly protein
LSKLSSKTDGVEVDFLIDLLTLDMAGVEHYPWSSFTAVKLRRGMAGEFIETEELNLTLTDKAVQQVKALLARDNRESHGLRVSVADGGCSGFSYKLDFAKEEKAGDRVLELNNLRVYIDPTSIPYLQGTTIDYVTSLYGGGFKFSNPNASGTCGCGTSFSA